MVTQDLQHPYLLCLLILLNIPVCVLLGKAVYGNRTNWTRQADRIAYCTFRERHFNTEIKKKQLTLAGILVVYIFLVVSEYALITMVIMK